jgi:hypothetical protein
MFTMTAAPVNRCAEPERGCQANVVSGGGKVRVSRRRSAKLPRMDEPQQMSGEERDRLLRAGSETAPALVFSRLQQSKADPLHLLMFLLEAMQHSYVYFGKRLAAADAGKRADIETTIEEEVSNTMSMMKALGHDPGERPSSLLGAVDLTLRLSRVARLAAHNNRLSDQDAEAINSLQLIVRDLMRGAQRQSIEWGLRSDEGK